MPYRSGIFQMALAAISVAAFLISNSFGVKPKEKKIVGRIERIGGETFQLTDVSAQKHCFQLSDSARVFLNDKEIPFMAIDNGRQAAVRFIKQKGIMVVTWIDIFPTHTDFEAPEAKT
jgi:hypothetical protein